MSMSRMAPVDSLAGSTAVHRATAIVAAPGRAVLAMPHSAATTMRRIQEVAVKVGGTRLPLGGEKDGKGEGGGLCPDFCPA